MGWGCWTVLESLPLIDLRKQALCEHRWSLWYRSVPLSGNMQPQKMASKAPETECKALRLNFYSGLSSRYGCLELHLCHPGTWQGVHLIAFTRCL